MNEKCEGGKAEEKQSVAIDRTGHRLAQPVGLTREVAAHLVGVQLGLDAPGGSAPESDSARAWAKAEPVTGPRTFHYWVRNQFGERLFGIFFKTYTEKVWGVPATEIQADWAAQDLFARQRVTSIVFDVEIIYLVRARGYRFSIVPIRWFDKRGSRMRVSPLLGARVLLDLARIPIIHTREGHRPDLSDAPRAKVERGAPSLEELLSAPRTAARHVPARFTPYR